MLFNIVNQTHFNFIKIESINYGIYYQTYAMDLKYIINNIIQESTLNKEEWIIKTFTKNGECTGTGIQSTLTGAVQPCTKERIKELISNIKIQINDLKYLIEQNESRFNENNINNVSVKPKKETVTFVIDKKSDPKEIIISIKITWKNKQSKPIND